MELFEENKKKALELKAEIDRTDREIDQMVYELYGLTEEEIRIVEGNWFSNSYHHISPPSEPGSLDLFDISSLPNL